MSHDELREELIKTDDEFRRLHQEHQECEERLATLQDKTLPSQEDEDEEKRIKLHKLALKDRMEALLRERSAQQVAV